VRELIQAGDTTTRRLFPPTYVGDPDRQAHYEELVGDDLRTSTLDGFAQVQGGLEAEILDPEEMAAWMRAVNSVRLVIGTLLDVGPDGDIDPELVAANEGLVRMYEFLSALLYEILGALRQDLPPA